MATGVVSWSGTAATNSSADSAVNWAEGQAPSSVNDSARGMMASVAKYRDDNAGSLTTAGSSTAYTLTTNQTFASLSAMSGHTVVFRAHTTSGATPTLNVDTLGAKAIHSVGGTVLPTGALIENGVYAATYDNSNSRWVLHGYIGYAALVPVGTVTDYAGSSAPSGWLLCYGQAVSRTTYSALFAILSTTYGSGDGSTTFNLPDLRGRVVAGQDDMGGSSANRLTNQTGGLDGDTLGATGGSETHTLTDAQMATAPVTVSISDPQHTHTLTQGTVVLRSDGGVGITASAGTGISSDTVSVDAASTGISASGVVAGSDEAHNNVQPTIILNKIIYAGV